MGIVSYREREGGGLESLEERQGGSQLLLLGIAIVMQEHHLPLCSLLRLPSDSSCLEELLEEVAGQDVVERRPVLRREAQQSAENVDGDRRKLRQVLADPEHDETWG
jgi:hypothetical protein